MSATLHLKWVPLDVRPILLASPAVAEQWLITAAISAPVGLPEEFLRRMASVFEPLRADELKVLAELCAEHHVNDHEALLESAKQPSLNLDKAGRELRSACLRLQANGLAGLLKHPDSGRTQIGRNTGYGVPEFLDQEVLASARQELDRVCSDKTLKAEATPIGVCLRALRDYLTEAAQLDAAVAIWAT